MNRRVTVSASTAIITSFGLASVGCEARGSAFEESSDTKTSGDVSTSDSSAPSGDTGGTDGGHSDTGAATGSWVFDEYPEDWLEAPAGYCEDPAHLTVSQYVFDGDTIEVTAGGKVRFLGVDASELSTSDCFSKDAQDALKALLEPDKTVCLYADPSGDATDLYGRMLRYVYIHHGGKWLMLNHRTVRLGMSKAYRFFLKGRTYEKQIEKAETDARDQSLGGWKACGWVIE